jgi:pyruvate formate lyase activating enzyme
MPQPARAQIVKQGLMGEHLSPWFTRLDKKQVQCELCPRQCVIPKGKRGFCRVRENRGGRLYSLAYGNPSALHLDPVELKPFYHVLPGTRTLSIATVGCNFACKFCQTWEMSQASPEDVYSYDVPPEAAVEKAVQMGAPSVAYAYVEPTVFYEYTLDTARLASEAGLLNVMHTNGYINRAPLEKLCTHIDAVNVDLKGWTGSFYQDLCDGSLEPVLQTLKILKEAHMHLEITNLLVPSLNDDMAMVREMCLWVKEELGPDTPLHFLRFYPLYKLTSLPPTPVSSLERARSAARDAGLHYVYIANVPGHEGENTFCPRCGETVIQRAGYMVTGMDVRDGKCGYCGQPVPGIWA